jgi:hypothetical protein
MTTDTPAGSSQAHALRLLLPFFFQHGSAADAVSRLCGLRHEGRKSRPCWTDAAPVPAEYRDETLPNVRDFLFDEGIAAGGCAYLRVPDETANAWFKNGGTFAPGPAVGARVPSDGERPGGFAVRLAAPGIELFLSPHRAGVLSVTLEPRDGGDLAVLQDLNYRLSQIRHFTAWWFRLPMAEQDPHQPPPDDAPLAERLGRRGGAFQWIDWAEFLLGPLAPLGYRRLQDQFSVYSVTRCGAAADFTDPAVTAALRPFLAALAHVEELGHAGTLQVTERVLNPRHWCAVGSLAAVHLIADQDPPRPFDAQRLPTVLHKYFVPYLVVLLQRIALQRLLGEARAAFAGGALEGLVVVQTAGGSGPNGRVHRLGLQSLALTVNGTFTEVSSREVLNQYYELVRVGLRVADSFGTLQRALRDTEVMDNDRFQGRTLADLGRLAGSLEGLVTEAGRHARLIAHVQSKVEWLEVFFVSYYFTALIYYVNHNGTLFSHEYGVWSLILAPAVSGLIAFLGLRPDKLHDEAGRPTTEDTGASHQHHAGHAWGFLGWLIGVFVLWLIVGFQWFPDGHGSHAAATVPMAISAPVGTTGSH